MPWKIIPMNDLFMNKEKSLFLLGSCAIEPANGMTVSHGKLKHILLNEMRTCGLDIILKDLDEFLLRRKNKYELSELEEMLPKDEKKFKKDYQYISIARVDNNQLELAPMKPRKGGYVGKEGTTVILPTTNELFFEILIKTFEGC